MSGAFSSIIQLRPVADDVFAGPPSPDRGARIYGGQLLAQSLAAAQQTLSDGRRVHATHSVFLKAGDPALPVEFSLDRLRDGRSFSQRQVTASQNGVEVLRSLISFHVPVAGLEWEKPVESATAAPTDDRLYTDYCDVIEAALHPAERPWSGRDRPFDVRFVNPPTLTGGRPVTEPQLMWMRVDGRLADDQSVHDAALAYLADLGMNPVILLPHGYSWNDDRVTEASLDHSMWFHRPARADEWLLYEQRVETTSGGRGFAIGRLYDLEGRLVATCAQEGLMRWKE